MKREIIHSDVAAEYSPEGKLQPKKVEWLEKSIYDIGEVRNVTEYQPQKKAGIGPCMGICVHKEHLYVIQNSNQYPGGRLCVLNADMILVGEYVGIGYARQIQISGNVAAITAREDGLWFFDISETTPKLLSHYQTIEFATGITLYSHFALVSCRQYGVEIVDIQNPAHPQHIGLIRVGEVQSACVCDDYLYCGVWGAMSIIIVDIHDITKAHVVGRIPLEGRGDGVFVHDNRLYAVTGQHRRGIHNVENKQDMCFGQGNGLVVIDISNLQKPQILHSESFGKCYNVGFDMWKPALCDSMILSGCSSLGVFGCHRENFKPQFRVSLPPEEKYKNDGNPLDVTTLHDAVTEFATLENTLYICGAHTDLYAFEWENQFGLCKRWDSAKKAKVSKPPLHVCREETLNIRKRYMPEGSCVLNLCQCGDILAVACGLDGVRLLDKEHYHEIGQFKTKGYCCDIKYASGYLVAAMSHGGIILYKVEWQSLIQTAHIEIKETVQQICISDDANYLLCGVGSVRCFLYDITDKRSPKLVSFRKASLGRLYGDNFTSGKLADGTMLMFWHQDGLVYTNPAMGDLSFHTIHYTRSKDFMGFGPENGCDTDGKRIFYNLNDGYVLLPMEGNINADTLPVYKTHTPIYGKLTVCGNYMVATERARGIVTVTDISDVSNPKHVGLAILNVSPGKPIYIDHKILLPAGYGGLLEVEFTLEKKDV